MSTISGLDLKREIIDIRLKSGETSALLSGFVRSCMSLEVTRKDGVLLVLDCQTDFVREYISSKMLSAYKISPKYKEGVLTYVDCEKLLRVLDITRDGGGLFEITGIPDCFKANASAYVRGMFLGCGSFSVHVTDDAQEKKTGGGYHIEFSLLSESLADELSALLESYKISVKKMVRAEKYVVYSKDSESVGNFLAFIHADKTALKLFDTVVTLSVKRDVNRLNNCDIANMTRTSVAAVNVTDAIDYIERTVGLETLRPKLLEAADARKNSPDASLADLAYELGISKSGLKHRYDKIVEFANDIKAKRGDD